MVLLDIKGDPHMRVEEYLHAQGVDHTTSGVVLLDVFQRDL